MLSTIGDIEMIVLKVSNRHFALREVEIIKASVILETKFIIYAINLDISRDFALFCLRVIVILNEQPHSINLTLDRPRVREVYSQRVLHILLRVREVNLVDLILKLESSIDTAWGINYSKSYHGYIIYIWLWSSYSYWSWIIYSFTLCIFAIQMRWEPEPLDCGLVVSKPTGESLLTESWNRLGEYKFEANLIVLDISDFDDILVIDWLESHIAVVDYALKKKLCLKSQGRLLWNSVGSKKFYPEVSNPIIGVRWVLRKKCSIYVAYVIDTETQESWLEDTTIVYKFPYVFLDELPKIPPNREIEFSIHLVPKTTPISIAPYMMASVELKELKVQL